MDRKTGSIFRGVATALITPFDDGAIDYGSLGRLIEYQISGGVDALLICGTTGEAATLDGREVCELIAFTVERVSGRVPVIAGVGSNCTRVAMGLAEYARASGADAVLAVTPYYNKASEGGLIAHYSAIARAAELPLIIYNVPSRTGMSISLCTWRELMSIEGVCGVKEASGSISYLSRLAALGGGLSIYSGNDDLILPTLSLGGLGVFSVLSNLLPCEVGQIYRSYFSGDIEGARALQLGAMPLIDAIFSEVNPIPIKALLAEVGLCREEYRLPLCALDEARRRELISLFDSSGALPKI